MKYKEKSDKNKSSKYEPESLIPSNYDDQVMREEEARKSA
jgi:hypothetical protein